MRCAIIDHICDQQCLFSIYLFKSLPVSRDVQNARYRKYRQAEAISSTMTQSVPVEFIDNHQSDDGVAHLLPLDIQTKASVIREWQTEMTTTQLGRVVCAMCAKWSALVETTCIHASAVDLSLLRNDCLHKKLLLTKYNLREYQNALLNVNGMKDQLRATRWSCKG